MDQKKKKQVKRKQSYRRRHSRRQSAVLLASSQCHSSRTSNSVKQDQDATTSFCVSPRTRRSQILQDMTNTTTPPKDQSGEFVQNITDQAASDFSSGIDIGSGIVTRVHSEEADQVGRKSSARPSPEERRLSHIKKTLNSAGRIQSPSPTANSDAKRESVSGQMTAMPSLDMIQTLSDATVASGAGEFAAVASLRFRITKADLGPTTNLLTSPTPLWQFEYVDKQWRPYSTAESVELDRYWSVYAERSAENPEDRVPHIAELRLKKNKVIVDFESMTCHLKGGKSRRLNRGIENPGWLTNSFLFWAFEVALSLSGVKVEAGAEEIFDFRFNQDFRTMKNDGRSLSRGGQPYCLPIGWKRFAVTVLGRYDEGEDAWLREDDEGWAVAYHGTSGNNLPGILSSGFSVGPRQKFEKSQGSGIYCTPWIEVAQHYSRPQICRDRSVQVVLQLRVRPSAIKPVDGPKVHPFEKNYWVINNPEDVRAYGVLLREFMLRDWVPAQARTLDKKDPRLKEMRLWLSKEADEQEKKLRQNIAKISSNTAATSSRKL